jgi:MFS family permease
VGGGIVRLLALVVSSGYDLAAGDDHGANRYIAVVERGLRLGERESHQFVGVHWHGTLPVTGYTRPSVRGTPRFALYVVFAVTGFSALTLQVVWQRVIALHSGVDLVSFTTVVAAFLAGLGLGNLVGGWLADRLGGRTSLLAFSGANLVIGLFAMASVWLFYDVYQAQAEQLSSPAAKFAFNAVLVLLPTTLMGL